MSKKPDSTSTPKPHIMQKKQLARWQREQKWQRIIMYAGSGLVAAIIIFVGVMFFITEIRPGTETVLVIDDKSYDLNYYTKVLSYYNAQLSGDSPLAITGYATQGIQNGQLMKSSAEKLGITVAEDEVKNALTAAKLPSDQAYMDIMRMQLLYKKLLSDYFEKQIPVSAEQVDVEAMFLESAKSAESVRSRLLKGEDFATIAAQESLESLSKSKSGALGWIPKGGWDVIIGNPKIEETAFTLNKGETSPPVFDAIQKPIGYWLIKITETETTGELIRAKAQGILLSSEEEALKVRDLASGGEDFTKLVQGYSQDLNSKEKDGDLGWSNEGMSALLQDAALKLKKDDISEPILDKDTPTLGGYWIIRAKDREADRAIDASVREMMVEKAFSDWLENLSSTSQMQNLLDSDKLAWAEKHLPKLVK